MSFLGGRVHLTLGLGDASALLQTLNFEADAWFLDGFSPAKNPELWTPEVLQLVTERSGLAGPAWGRGARRVMCVVRSQPWGGRLIGCLDTPRSVTACKLVVLVPPQSDLHRAPFILLEQVLLVRVPLGPLPSVAGR